MKGQRKPRLLPRWTRWTMMQLRSPQGGMDVRLSWRQGGQASRRAPRKTGRNYAHRPDITVSIRNFRFIVAIATTNITSFFQSASRSCVSGDLFFFLEFRVICPRRSSPAAAFVPITTLEKEGEKELHKARRKDGPQTQVPREKVSHRHLTSLPLNQSRSPYPLIPHPHPPLQRNYN